MSKWDFSPFCILLAKTTIVRYNKNEKSIEPEKGQNTTQWIERTEYKIENFDSKWQTFRPCIRNRRDNGSSN